MTRVVFLIVDALPDRHVHHALMPNLARLAAEGGRSRGRAAMTSATYPNHATFVTGVDPLEHGLLANWIVKDGTPTPSHLVGPAVPTIFDACRVGGRSSAAVLGDQNLVGVMGARAADHHWPLDGILGGEVERDGHGYATNREVMSRLLPLLDGDRPDLVVAHLNEPDTAAHVHGPDSEEAQESYRGADAAIGEIVTALGSTWDDTVLVVVSDHDQEDVDDAIELHRDAARAGVPVVCLPEGTAAVVWGKDDSRGAWLDAVEGVAGHRELRDGVRLVWSAPRRCFRPPREFQQEAPDRGTHGGPRTRAQVAIVAGGDPRATAVTRGLNGRAQIEASEWAGVVLGLLNIDRNSRSNTTASSPAPNT